MSPLSFNIFGPLWWLIGPPILTILIPLLIKYLTRCNAVKDALCGKVVLVTGASGGLGEALCHAFYLQGCKLIIAARRTDQLERVKKDLLSLSCDKETFVPEILQMDLSDLASMPDKVKTALAIYNGIDILINNAGLSFRGEVIDSSVDVHKKIMLVNYFGQICLTKAILDSMIPKKAGHIVMISSVQGRIGIPFRSAYAASKHALQAYSDCLRSEVDKHGIKVTVISPGYISTNLSENALTGSGELYARTDAATESGYSPTEVAKKVVSAVKFEENEIVIAPLAPRLAIIIRTLWPDLYFLIMNRRARSSQ